MPTALHKSLGLLTFSLLCATCGLSMRVSNEICDVKRDSETLYLLVLAPFLDPDVNSTRKRPGWEAGPALVPAARVAVEHINSRCDVLPDYQLKLLERDSGCNLVDRAVISFTEEIFHSENKTIVGIIGPACSEPTLLLAPLTIQNELNLIQMSIATTPLINNANPHYANTYRTVSSSLKYIDAFEALVKFNGWNYMAALYESLRKFHITTFNEFREKMGDKLAYSAGIESGLFSLPEALSSIVTARTRIIVVIGGADLARKILCAGYKSGLRYPSYQWYFLDRVMNDFLKLDGGIIESVGLNGNTVLCSEGDFEEALIMNGSVLSINQFSRVDRNSKDTVSQRSFNDFLIEYIDELNDYLEEVNLEPNDSRIPRSAFLYFTYFYDATWALSLSLNRSVDNLKSLLTDYYSNTSTAKEVGDIVRSQLKYIDFEGMSGRITFAEERHDVATTDVELFHVRRNSNGHPVEDLSARYTNCSIVNYNATFINDTFATIVEEIPLGLGVFIFIVLALLFMLTISLQMVVFCYADLKSIKASSPQLNHLIFSGSYLLLIGALIYTVQEVFTSKFVHQPVLYSVNCSVYLWNASFAGSLIFGTVCGKTWRIYRIFTHFKRSKIKYISDIYLVSFVVVLLLLDFFVLCLWNLINPWHLSLVSERPNTAQQLVERYECSCDNLIIWVVVFLFQKCLLAIAVICLSILSRRVHRKEFRSTLSINIWIYSMCAILMIGISLVVFTRINNLPVLSFVAAISLQITIVLLAYTFLIFPSFLPIIKQRYGHTRAAKVLLGSVELKRKVTRTITSPKFEIPTLTNSPRPHHR